MSENHQKEQEETRQRNNRISGEEQELGIDREEFLGKRTDKSDGKSYLTLFWILNKQT